MDNKETRNSMQYTSFAENKAEVKVDLEEVEWVIRWIMTRN